MVYRFYSVILAEIQTAIATNSIMPVDIYSAFAKTGQLVDNTAAVTKTSSKLACLLLYLRMLQITFCLCCCCASLLSTIYFCLPKLKDVYTAINSHWFEFILLIIDTVNLI